jgi:OHCU decarboxylase
VNPPISLQQLNRLSTDEFVERLTGIFEHSPWVAARAATQRPFASRQLLIAAMRTVVDEASPAEQLALIRAHPPLGSRGRSLTQLTVASAREQRDAGLQACTPQDSARLDVLNAAYHERFGMPFILAVRGHDPASIIATFEARLANDPVTEQATALREIGLIAGFRLADAVTDP